MAVTITITNQKGGVGKSTTVIHVGHQLVRNKFRVLIIDMDSQYNLSEFFLPSRWDISLYDLLSPLRKQNRTDSLAPSLMTITTETKYLGLFLAPSHPDLDDLDDELRAFSNRPADALATIFQDDQEFINSFDYVLIDTPPTFNMLTRNALVASDYFIVPVQAGGRWSMYGITRLLRKIDKLRDDAHLPLIQLGLIVTLMDKRYNADQLTQRNLEKHFSSDRDGLFKQTITRSTGVDKALLQGRSVIDYLPDNAAATDYIALTDEIVERIRLLNE